MNLKDLKTLADVSRWLAHHVEWSSEASSDMATRAVTIIDDAVANEGRCGVSPKDRASLRARAR
jgi:hypothetical protein